MNIVVPQRQDQIAYLLYCFFAITKPRGKQCVVAIDVFRSNSSIIMVSRLNERMKAVHIIEIRSFGSFHFICRNASNHTIHCFLKDFVSFQSISEYHCTFFDMLAESLFSTLSYLAWHG